MQPAKSHLRSATEGFFITLFGDTFYRGLSVVATFIVLFWLTPYEYGVWRLLLGALASVSLISLTGITGVLVADISRAMGEGNQKRAHAIMWRGSTILIGAGALAAMLFALSAPLVTHVSKIDLTIYLWILALAVFFGSVLQAVQVLYQARLQPARASITKNIGSVSYLLSLVLFVGVWEYGILGVALSFVLSLLVPAIWSAPYLVSALVTSYKEREKGSYSLKATLWGRSRYALLNDYAGAIANALWPWLVGYFLSIETVAYVGLAMVIANQVFSMLPISYVLRAILPRFVDETHRLADWLTRGMRYSLYLHTIVAVGVFSVALILFPIFLPSYVVAIPLAAALLISLPFRALALVVTEWFYAMHKQKELFLATAVPKFVSLALLPLFLPFLGIAGVVLWQVVAADAVLVFRLHYIKKELPIHTDLKSLLVLDSKDFELFERSWSRLKEHIFSFRKI